MKIGIPKEIKTAEGRIALLPDACHELVESGHDVFVQKEAGVLSGFPDTLYQQSGCRLVDTASDLYGAADLIVKVKEPQESEYALIESRHLLFCYLHLAAYPEVTNTLSKAGCTAIAFEGVTDTRGELPLLRPMSVIAGKLALQYASVLLHKHYGGRGMLLEGVAGVPRAQVTVLGYGTAGSAAVRSAARLGAQVTVIDKLPAKLEEARGLGPNVTSLFANARNIDNAVRSADVLIGAVLIPEQRAPVIVSREQVRAMRSGSVIVDIAVDQGGCVETTRPTTYDNPTYIEHDIVHFAVANIPGAVPESASQALSGSISPYVKTIAAGTWRQNSHIVSGLSIDRGDVVYDKP